jgi:hypothetical protein
MAVVEIRDKSRHRPIYRQIIWRLARGVKILCLSIRSVPFVKLESDTYFNGITRHVVTGRGKRSGDVKKICEIINHSV